MKFEVLKKNVKLRKYKILASRILFGSRFFNFMKSIAANHRTAILLKEQRYNILLSFFL